MSNPIIAVTGIGKQYRLGSSLPYRTFADAIKLTLYAPIKRLRGIRNPNKFFWALKNISFEVQEGEIIGIIGKNGAGKSTLLKILSRITTPTEGIIEIHGRIGSLLEVGTGFHPELTGRENIFLNGSILGMKKKEIESKFEEIVKFSELADFIDTPVKRYSSGMYVRLAFAVAAHLEPEILIVDEVLAVGDHEFQKKCLGKMGELSKKGRTVLFVSHNMAAIQNLCSRCLLLDKGKIVMSGRTDEVIRGYINTGLKNCSEFDQSHIPEKLINLRKVRIISSEENKCSDEFRFDEPITIEIHYEVNRRVNRCTVWFGIRTMDDIIAFDSAESDVDPLFLEVKEPGYYIANIDLPTKWLNAGEYYLVVGINTFSPITVFDRVEAVKFSILDTGTPEKLRTGADRPGILQPYLKWVVMKDEKIDKINLIK